MKVFLTENQNKKKNINQNHLQNVNLQLQYLKCSHKTKKLSKDTQKTSLFLINKPDWRQ